MSGRLRAWTTSSRGTILVERLFDVQSEASDASDFVRAARLARRARDTSRAELLSRALVMAPADSVVGAMFDDAHAENAEARMRAAQEALEGTSGSERARAACAMAGRWLERFGDEEGALALFAQAEAADPTDPAASLAAIRVLAARGAAGEALDHVDRALSKVEEGSTAERALLAAALELALSQVADSAAADRYAARLSARDPEHPSVRTPAEGKAAGGDPREASVSEQETSDNEVELEGPEVDLSVDDEPAVEAAEDVARELSAEEQAQLAELDDAIEKFTQQKRWTDVIRSMVSKAEILLDPVSKVELLAEAGRMYLDKSSNQAEAIKCFESVLEHDPGNLEAIEQLKEMYEKRRDWESLVRIRQRAAKLLDEADRLFEQVEIAQLATQRLRKPELCIELWQDVLEADPENPEALSSLAQLYERAREWEPLAKVLDKQVEQIDDEKELKQALQKLGMIYADKLNDDAGAVSAFKRLLMLDPDDRRAQEQLKRRYVALKAWDELEDFYAATEKWDELIRTIEREAESKDGTEEERIDLLFRAARLWEEKKDQPPRAARAYEKILSTDETNLDAAVALSPIYERPATRRSWRGCTRFGSVTRRSRGSGSTCSERRGSSTKRSCARPRTRSSASSRRSRRIRRRRSSVRTSSVWPRRRTAGTRRSRPTATPSRRRPTRTCRSSSG